jgi:hypothetical protein
MYQGRTTCPFVYDVAASGRNEPFAYTASVANTLQYSQEESCARDLYTLQTRGTVGSSSLLTPHFPLFPPSLHHYRVLHQLLTAHSSTMRLTTASVFLGSIAMQGLGQANDHNVRSLAIGRDDWHFCDVSSQCLSGCCSKQYSDDGRLKCTPGGSPSQCVGNPRPDPIGPPPRRAVSPPKID